MQYKNYGRTGRRVSTLGFGAMRLPKLEDGTCDFDQSVPILRRGLDLGITYIDSARGYINGTSEVAVGKAIKGYDREKLFVVTKIPSNDPKQFEEQTWREKLEEQLGRYQEPYLDLLLFHGLRWEAFQDYVSRPGEGLAQARQAQSEGLIRHIGFSSHDTTENIIKLMETDEFDGVLMQYNFLDTRNASAISKAAETGMGVTIMGPVAGGRLGVPGEVALPGEGMKALRVPELALRFVWDHPGVTVALSGMNEMVHVTENVAAADNVAQMTTEERTQVTSLIERNRRTMELYCTGCEYCMPCPHDINIPENFRYMNWHQVWGLTEQAKEAYGKMSLEGFGAAWRAGKVVGLPADQCVACGECEPKCPQNIPIIDQLKETAEALG